MVRELAYSQVDPLPPKAGGAWMGESSTNGVPSGSGCLHQTLALVLLGSGCLHQALSFAQFLLVLPLGSGCLHQTLGLLELCWCCAVEGQGNGTKPWRKVIATLIGTGWSHQSHAAHLFIATTCYVLCVFRKKMDLALRGSHFSL